MVHCSLRKVFAVIEIFILETEVKKLSNWIAQPFSCFMVSCEQPEVLGKLSSWKVPCVDRANLDVRRAALAAADPPNRVLYGEE